MLVSLFCLVVVVFLVYINDVLCEVSREDIYIFVFLFFFLSCVFMQEKKKVSSSRVSLVSL